MTDETPEKRTRRRPPPGDVSPPVSPGPGAESPGNLDDPDAALMRLESLGTPGAPGRAPLPPDRVASGPPTPGPAAPSRPASSTRRTPRSRPRPAASPSSTRTAARIAAPVVFLIAVIALIGIVVQSGVMRGSTEPTPTPAVKPTKTKGGSIVVVTKKYVVKSGDSLSSIAERFDTTTTTLQELNPELSGTTLRVGERIVVPKQ